MSGVQQIFVGENAENNCALSAVYCAFREEAQSGILSEYAV
jgi:hypothetical protein